MSQVGYVVVSYYVLINILVSMTQVNEVININVIPSLVGSVFTDAAVDTVLTAASMESDLEDFISKFFWWFFKFRRSCYHNMK